MAETQNDLSIARHQIEDALKYLRDIKSNLPRLSYKLTQKCGFIYYRQRDYANAYSYLTLWHRRAKNYSHLLR